MTIEEAGPNPHNLAAAIHHQLGDRDGAVPVETIAKALDIVAIRKEPLTNLEAALITCPERDIGMILVNAGSSRQRCRYSLGHELGHFLNPWHQPTDADGFWCSRNDMRIGNWAMRRGLTPHQNQEAEANRFAIELLMPPRRLRQFLSSEPDLEKVLGAARAFDVSREAAARRYVELHDATIAIAFSQEGRLRYWADCDAFPRPAIGRGQAMPALPQARQGAPLSDLEEADSGAWLVEPGHRNVMAQTLHQKNGFAMTLVIVEGGATEDDGDENDSVEDAFSRFARFSDR